MPFFRASGGASGGGVECLAKIEEAVASLGEHEVVRFKNNGNYEKYTVYAGQTRNLPTPAPQSNFILVDPSKLTDCSSITIVSGSESRVTVLKKDGTVTVNSGNCTVSLSDVELIMSSALINSSSFVFKLTGVA